MMHYIILYELINETGREHELEFVARNDEQAREYFKRFCADGIVVAPVLLDERNRLLEG